jgi:hypothetical protein
LEGLARLAVGGDVDRDVAQRLHGIGVLDASGQLRTELVPMGRTVAAPLADVELLRASAGDVAEVHGWWGPDLLLLHTTTGVDEVAPYVLAAPDALPAACLHALRLPDRPAAPTRVALDDVASLVDVGRAHGPRWAADVGAARPEDLALHRWDVAAPQRRAAVVRAVVSAPDGLRVLRHEDGRPWLVPTDRATEELEFASVTRVLRTTTAGDA